MSSIFRRVRKRFEESPVEVDPHDWQLPSSYPTSTKAGKATVIPDPAIFRNALIPNPLVSGASENSLVYPDISHAAVHLALLECFRNLRHSAVELSIKSEAPQLPSYDFSEKSKRSSTLGVASDSKQWNLLIRLAIGRFELWWTNIDEVFKHAIAYTHHAGDKAGVQLTKDYLPPLDVLLVWYAFMLDAEEYAKACHGCSIPHLTQLCFPWPAIRDVIDRETMSFAMTSPAESLFKTLTEQSADILQYIQAPPAYTEASLPSVSIDFFGMVKKQEPFFELSNRLLWIRSPSLVGSLDRSFCAYVEAQTMNDLFFVATENLAFGIDLIWRTHRLYPARYWLFRQNCSELTAPNELSGRSSHTASKTSLCPSLTNAICACWTCERIRNDLPTFRLPRMSSLLYRSLSARQGEPWNIRGLASLSSDEFRTIQDDLGFYYAVARAREQGRPLPVRSQ